MKQKMIRIIQKVQIVIPKLYVNYCIVPNVVKYHAMLNVTQHQLLITHCYNSCYAIVASEINYSKRL